MGLQHTNDQRGLWAMAWAIRGVGFGKSNWIVALSVLLVCGACAWAAEPEAVIAWTEAWAAQGAVYAGTFLGFLLTGFTFLATLGQRRLFLTMSASRPPKHPEVTWLEYCFFAFMRVMGLHFLLLLLCLGVLLLGGRDGAVSAWARELGFSHQAIRVPVKALFLLQAFLVAFCVMSLRTFTLDVYRTVILTLQWEIIAEGVEPHGGEADSVEESERDTGSALPATKVMKAP